MTDSRHRFLALLLLPVLSTGHAAAPTAKYSFESTSTSLNRITELRTDPAAPDPQPQDYHLEMQLSSWLSMELKDTVTGTIAAINIDSGAVTSTPASRDARGMVKNAGSLRVLKRGTSRIFLNEAIPNEVAQAASQVFGIFIADIGVLRKVGDATTDTMVGPEKVSVTPGILVKERSLVVTFMKRLSADSFNLEQTTRNWTDRGANGSDTVYTKSVILFTLDASGTVSWGTVSDSSTMNMSDATEKRWIVTVAKGVLKRLP